MLLFLALKFEGWLIKEVLLVYSLSFKYFRKCAHCGFWMVFIFLRILLYLFLDNFLVRCWSEGERFFPFTFIITSFISSPLTHKLQTYVPYNILVTNSH